MNSRSQDPAARPAEERDPATAATAGDVGTTSHEFRAPEYCADGSFDEAEYRFVGSAERGWTVYRNGGEYLRLGPGYRALRTHGCGICSTDLDRHFLPFPLPQVTGHELVADDAEGRHHVVEINASHHARSVRNDCAFCASGLPSHCPERLVLGIHDLPGGFGSWILAPVDAVLPLPPEIPFETALLIEPFAASLRAVVTIAPRSGETIAVLGPRRLGLLVVAARGGRMSSSVPSPAAACGRTGGGAGRPPQEKRYRLPDPRHLAPRAAARAGGSPRCDRYPALERSRRFTSGPDRRRRDRHHGEPAGARTRRAPGEEGGPSQVDARPAQRRARESDRAGRRRDRSGAVAGRDRRGPGLAPDSERRPGRGRAVREDRVAGRHRPTRLADLVRRTSGAWRRRRRAAGRLRAKRGARRAAASRRRRGAERRAGRLRDPAELGVGALTGATARRDRVAALPRAPPRRLSAPSRRGGPRAPAVELALRRLSRGDRSGPA